MISDENANDMCESFDNFLMDCVEKYDLSFIESAAIMLGRITRISEEIEVKEEMASIFMKGAGYLTEEKVVH